MSSADLLRLRSIYDQGTSETKRYVLKILGNYSGWDLAGDFLKGVMEDDEKIRHTAFALLRGWYNYSINLSREMNDTEINYVMKIYREMDIESLELPDETKKILNEIPFIFKKK
jgi:hypothetical protein